MTSYYDILEIPPTASQLDIKKAYRRLALLHHPDRNPSASSKERFQQIGEAYACLSDVHQRELYDWDLRSNNGGGGGRPATQYQSSSSSPTAAANHTSSFRRNQNYHHTPFDSRAQFDYLFQTDPFFRDYFQTDEELEREFANLSTPTTSSTTRQPAASSIQEGWFSWLLRQCGISFTMTTVVQDGQGNVRASRQVVGGERGRTTNSSNGVQQETRSFIENGQRVMIRKRQKNGTVIEDKMIQNQVVERRINGVAVPLNDIPRGNTSTATTTTNYY